MYGVSIRYALAGSRNYTNILGGQGSKLRV